MLTSPAPLDALHTREFGSGMRLKALHGGPRFLSHPPCWFWTSSDLAIGWNCVVWVKSAVRELMVDESGGMGGSSGGG